MEKSATSVTHFLALARGHHRTFFSHEAEAQEVTNIRKPSRPVLPKEAVTCSDTRICPEPTVPQAVIHLDTARLP